MRRLGIPVLVVALLAGCATSSPPPPEPADVAAAKACELFLLMFRQKATSQEVLNAAQALTAGVAADEASSLPLPKWSQLGANIVALTSEGVQIDINVGTGVVGTGLAVQFNNKMGECRSIPTSAKKAGGYKPPTVP